jgi:ABC-type Mn2+/Zn2+ transport system permease subunit
MKNLIILILVLAGILVAVSRILDPMMGIFIVCLAACLLLDWIKKRKETGTDEWEDRA